jgi:hypothetical protein
MVSNIKTISSSNPFYSIIEGKEFVDPSSFSSYKVLKILSEYATTILTIQLISKSVYKGVQQNSRPTTHRNGIPNFGD